MRPWKDVGVHGVWSLPDQTERHRRPPFRRHTISAAIDAARRTSLTGRCLSLGRPFTHALTCRDGSRLRFTEQKGDPPQKGEIFEADVGQIIKARIDAYCEENPSGWCPPFFRVMATEI
jgi:hypothetical protein